MDGEPVALVVVGLGAVGSSLVAGVEAARTHLTHPFGSLVEGGGAGRREGILPWREKAPFAELGDLVLGAFELKEDDAHRAALRAGVLSRSVIDELRPQLRQVRAMMGARQAPTRRHLADALGEDLRGFLAHHRCARGVVVCTLPGPRAAGALPFTAAEVYDALERDEGVTPGLVYAAAAAQAGFGFVAAGRDATLRAPGVAQLFAEAGQPVAGAGLLGPDAVLREALAMMLAREGLGLSGTASLSTRAEEHGARLWGGPDRTQEMALAQGFGGGCAEVSIELRGQVAAFLAGRALDAALCLELAARAGRSGAQGWLEGLFEEPLAGAQPREARAETLLEKRARLEAELPVLAAATRRAA